MMSEGERCLIEVMREGEGGRGGLRKNIRRGGNGREWFL